MAKRTRLWRELQGAANSKMKPHDLMKLPQFAALRSEFRFDPERASAQERTAMQQTPISCGCAECGMAYFHLLFECNLYFVRKAAGGVRAPKPGEVITARCTECHLVAKSNRAAICNSATCAKSKRKKYKLALKRKQRPKLARMCIVCKVRPVKRANAKLCQDKACYNTHHKEMAKQRAQRSAAAA